MKINLFFKYIFLVLTLLHFKIGISQNPVFMPHTSDETTTDGAQNSVDPSSGKLNISIPLVNLSHHDNQISVGLNYHSGVKVNDPGLGIAQNWNLMAGGKITRILQGEPDEANDQVESIDGNMINRKGFWHLPDWATFDRLLDEEDINEKPKVIASNKGALWRNTGLNENNDIDLALDSQPDIFNLNLGGSNFQIVFDKPVGSSTSPKPYTIPHIPGVKIKYTEGSINGVNGITGFEITTTDGTTYFFGGEAAIQTTISSRVSKSVKYKYVDACDNHQNGCIAYDTDGEIIYMGTFEGYPDVGAAAYAFKLSPELELKNGLPDIITDSFITPEYTSSWYLYKVTSPTNNNVYYNYIDENIIYAAGKNESLSQINMPRVRICTDNNGCAPSSSKLFHILPFCYDIDNYNNCDKPTYQTFTFSRRNIQTNLKRISNIQMGPYEVKFVYGDDREDLIGSKKLDQVEQYKDGELLFKHILEYELNGENTSAPMKIYNLGHDENGNPFFLNEYEVNDFEAIPSLGEIIASAGKRLFLTKIQLVAGSKSLPPYRFEYNQQTIPYQFSSKQDLYGYANNNPMGTLIPNKGYDSFVLPESEQSRLIGFFEDISLSFKWFEIHSNGSGAPGALREPNASLAVSGSMTSMSTPNGNRSEFVYEGNSDNLSNALPGIRIKEVKSYPRSFPLNNLGTPISTFYDYSGGLSKLNENFYIQKQTDGGITKYEGLVDDGNGNYYEQHKLQVGFERLTYNSSGFRASFSGKEIGYSKVTVSKENNGKKEMHFQHDNDEGAPATYLTRSSPIYKRVRKLGGQFDPDGPRNHAIIYPFPPVTSYDWKNGKLQKSMIYKEDGTLLKETEISYSTPQEFPDHSVYGTIPGYNIYRYYSGIYKETFSGKYKHISSVYLPTSKTSRTYNPQDPNQQPMSTLIESEYNTENGKIKEERTIDSEGNTIIKRSFYIVDFIDDQFNYSGSDEHIIAMVAMRDQNKLNYPVEVQNWIIPKGETEKYLYSSKLIQYKLFNGIPMPYKDFELFTDAPLMESEFESCVIQGNDWNQDIKYELMNVFHYDEYLNLEQIDKAYLVGSNTDYQHSTQIWGGAEKGQLLLQASNTQRNDIFYENFETSNSVTPGRMDSKSYFFPGEKWVISDFNHSTQGDYIISYWVKDCNNVYGTGCENNEWYYKEILVQNPTPGTISTDVENGWVDDIVIYPVGTNFSYNTYDKFGKINSVTDANHVTISQEHDEFGRLKLSKDQHGNIIQAYKYHLSGLGGNQE